LNNKKSNRKSNKGQQQSRQQASRSTTKTNVSGKLGSNGKLIQQERQCWMDNNLCLFCVKGGHRVTDCNLTKANSLKARTITTTFTDSKFKDKKKLADAKKE
jgi:hypothetical protein